MSVNCPIECAHALCPHPDFIERNGAFLLTIIASASASFALTLNYFLKSRCRNLKCGCITCDRDVLEITEGQL